MAESSTGSILQVGTGEIDITPSVGTALAGSLFPRTSVGIQDPLTVKAVVLESRGARLAYVLLDLIALRRDEGDHAVEWDTVLAAIRRDLEKPASSVSKVAKRISQKYGVSKNRVYQEALTIRKQM